MFPSWFHDLASLALILGAGCAVIVTLDVLRHPQHMAIMNIVWPVTALFGTVFVVWAYFRYGRLASHEAMHQARSHGEDMPSKTETPFPIMVGKGALHCGSGCMLGDIAAEWLAFAVPSIAVALGWQTIFADKMFAVWILDFIFAFLLGIVFQYFAIAPMRNLTFAQGILAALKADALSLAAWQVGMYGWMAIMQFAVYPMAFGARPDVDTQEFWFAMQMAMVAGFITAYPVNWWLMSTGVKERM